jgi:cytochrome c biogenesis protein CcmG, thiol:disulfide interchange protein DsbE
MAALHRLLLAAVATAASLALPPALAVETGQPAPELKLPGRSGEVVLAALQGKVVLVDFWASWCGPCRQSFPWMNAMQAKYGARGLQIVAVNVDAKRADADRFLEQVPASFSIAFDSQGDTPRRFAIKGMPTSVLVGADGRVADRHAGFRDDDKPALEAAIVAALAKAGR